MGGMRPGLCGWLCSSLNFLGCDEMLSPFVAELRTREMSSFCSFETLLYVRVPSMLRCPVLPMMSCSSTPLWKGLVALVTRKEWLLLKQPIPAVSQRCFTVFDSVLWPMGVVPYQTAPSLVESGRTHCFC